MSLSMLDILDLELDLLNRFKGYHFQRTNKRSSNIHFV